MGHRVRVIEITPDDIVRALSKIEICELRGVTLYYRHRPDRRGYWLVDHTAVRDNLL